jgi:hypothetical protein
LACAFASVVAVIGGVRVDAGAAAIPLLMQHVKPLSEHSRSASVALPLMNMLQTLQAQGKTARWTAGVEDSLNSSSSQLDDVQASITAHKVATQADIDAMVSTIVGVDGQPGQAKQSSNAKTMANSKNSNWLACVAIEEAALIEIKEKQALVRLNMSAQITPCADEYATQFFNMTEKALSVSCSLDNAGEDSCASGLSTLGTDREDAEDRIAKFVAENVEAHHQAEAACHLAKNNTADAIAAVEGAQTRWTNQHSTCVGKLATRNFGICEFGEKLNRVCQSVSSYDARKQSIDGSDNLYSLADMKTEMRTVVLVQCLLNTFKTSQDLTSADVTDCQNGVDSSPLVTALKINDKQSDVLSAQSSNGVSCVNGEEWTFEVDAATKHKYTVPDFVVKPQTYEIDTSSHEDAVTTPYARDEDWSSQFTSREGSNFAECPQDSS